jgi:hypothetical protein
MTYLVVHELKERLASCVPVFSTDGLKHYCVIRLLET